MSISTDLYNLMRGMEDAFDENRLNKNTMYHFLMNMESAIEQVRALESHVTFEPEMMEELPSAEIIDLTHLIKLRKGE